MKFFDELGTSIERTWRRADYDPAAFRHIASDALVERRPATHVQPHEILGALLEQASVHYPFPGHFGEPPITLFSAQRFYIEALFWMSSTTSVHQHGFSGAFHVLAGSSVHSRWDWQPERQVSERFQLGRATQTEVELLSAGDTRTIAPADGLVHALFHLEHPSVTIVVRTFTGPGSQYDIHPPFVAFEPARKNHLLDNQLAALDVLWRSEDPRGPTLATEFLRHADLETCYLVLRAASFAKMASCDREALFDVVRARHPAEVARFEVVFRESLRRSNLVARRGLVTDPNHKFLLALLLYAQDRPSIARLVRSRHAGDPFVHVRRWTDELLQQRVAGPLGPTALGVTLNDDERRILGLRLQGLELGDVLATLSDEYDDIATHEPAIARLLGRIADHPVLRPLVT